MGLFSSKDDKNVAEYKAARRDLERTSKGKKHEDEEYHRANKRVIDAEKNIPWHKR